MTYCAEGIRKGVFRLLDICLYTFELCSRSSSIVLFIGALLFNKVEKKFRRHHLILKK